MPDNVRPAFDTRSILSEYLEKSMNRNRGYPSEYIETDLLSFLNGGGDIPVNEESEENYEDGDVAVDTSSYKELQKKYGNQLDSYMNKSVGFPWAGTILGGSNIVSGILGGPTYGQGINWLNEAMGRPGEKLYDTFGGFDNYEEMNDYYKNLDFQKYIRTKNKDKIGFGVSYDPLGIKNTPTTN